MLIKFGLLGLLVLVGYTQADNWAVLVAGSSGWGNYRHQADVCHAYQVLRERGFPMQNVITMMFDDIAYNKMNPMKGQIINKPYGPDVYTNVKIDYKGKDVNPTNFLNILKGNEAALRNVGSGKVVKSGPEDNVFIFFVDHGGPGVLSFPFTVIYADDIANTLKTMASNRQFNKLLFFVDACESGSVFNNILKENINVLVFTAAAPDEPSKGWYCGNPQLGVCLADLFSVSWTQHMDQILGTVQGNEETLWDLYNDLRTLVNASHVQLYGDFQMGLNGIETFFGKSSAGRRIHNQQVMFQEQMTDVSQGVPNWDAELHSALTSFERAPSHLKSSREKEYQNILEKREFADRIMSNIVELSTSGGNTGDINNIMNSKLSLNLENFACYKNLVQHFNNICFNTAQNSYLLRYLNKFVNICSSHTVSEDETIQAMKMTCGSHTRNMVNIV